MIPEDVQVFKMFVVAVLPLARMEADNGVLSLLLTFSLSQTTEKCMKQQRDRPHEQDDAILVARVLAGEREAFDILLQRYASSVQRLCTTLLGTTVEAQDIAQEAALQAFLGLSRLRDPARFAAWFHAIAANLARSALRRRSERSLEMLSEESMTQLVWIETPQTPEEHQMEREIH